MSRFHLLEAWLTNQLLASPTFHRAIRSLHKKFHEMRHGVDPADMGGTKIDHPNGSESQRFLKHYMDEIRDQFRGLTRTKR